MQASKEHKNKQFFYNTRADLTDILKIMYFWSTVVQAFITCRFLPHLNRASCIFPLSNTEVELLVIFPYLILKECFSKIVQKGVRY